MSSEGRAAHESDEALGARAHEGDKDAFATLYERHHGAIYDFAVRILRDRDAAADVVQNTFTRAWPALREGEVPRSIKAWLFGVARNLSIDELRRRRRVSPNDGVGLGLAELEDVNAFDPSEVVETKELAELVWSSAAGLRAEEYALLDLHVRRGLSADELAESLGLRRGAVYTRLTRLRGALEKAVATSLLLRHGRDRQLAIRHVLFDGREVDRRNGERHEHRLHAGNRHQFGLAGRDEAADFHVHRAGTAVNRRANDRVAERHSRIFDRSLLRHELCPRAFDRGFVGLDHRRCRVRLGACLFGLIL